MKEKEKENEEENEAEYSESTKKLIKRFRNVLEIIYKYDYREKADISLLVKADYVLSYVEPAIEEINEELKELFSEQEKYPEDKDE
jgi:hypothetical protein